MHWVYLGAHTERLDQVGLGDFDGEKRCDVFAIDQATSTWKIAPGGSGAWTTLLGTYAGIPMSELRFGDFNGDKITDVFRRAPSGQWLAISPGRWGWTALAQSSIPLADLRFGDFDGNGITDVLSLSGGTASVSWNATSTWQPLNSAIDDLESVLIANVDGLPGDNLVRYVATGPSSGQWMYSSGGSSPWTPFASYQPAAPAPPPRAFVGRFKGGARADLRWIDTVPSRVGRIIDVGEPAFTQYGLYPY